MDFAFACHFLFGSLLPFSFFLSLYPLFHFCLILSLSLLSQYIHTHIYIYIYHHHHHVVPLARISLTLSRHSYLSFIVFGWSSALHPVSSHSCCMYVRAGRPAFAWPYAGVHRSTSLMSSSLLLQQCPACLVRLTCNFSWWEASGSIFGVLWGVTSRTCSLLLSTFLCKCRLTSYDIYIYIYICVCVCVCVCVYIWELLV